jgi:hypothetical protein
MTVPLIDDIKVAVREVLDERDAAAIARSNAVMRASTLAMLERVRFQLDGEASLHKDSPVADEPEIHTTNEEPWRPGGFHTGSHRWCRCWCPERERCVPHECSGLNEGNRDVCAEHWHVVASKDPITADATPERYHATICTCTPMTGLRCRPHAGTKWASWVQCEEHHHDAVSLSDPYWDDHPPEASEQKVERLDGHPTDSDYAKGLNAGIQMALKQIKETTPTDDGPDETTLEGNWGRGYDAGQKAYQETVVSQVRALLPPFEPPQWVIGKDPVGWLPKFWREIGNVRAKKLGGYRVAIDNPVVSLVDGEPVYVRRDS